MTTEELNGLVDEFADQFKFYCARCGRESPAQNIFCDDCIEIVAASDAETEP